MSVEAITVVLHHSQATGTAKLVLVGIANHDGDGGAWPSIATLAKYAGLKDPRRVKRVLRQLEDMGEIRTERNMGGFAEMRDDRRPNRYTVTLRCPSGCDGTQRHEVADGPPRDGDGVVVALPRGGRSAPHGVVAGPPEPSLNQQEPSGGASAPPRKRGTRIPEQFIVTPDMKLWAHEHCPDIDWRLHTKRFVAHFKSATGSKALKLDWTQTWRKWLLKEQDDAATRRQPARAHL